MERPLRILLVEDGKIDAIHLRRTIEKNGIQFIDQLVMSKDAYIEALNNFDPDIILSDYSLPHFDGMKALKLRNELAPDIPFILVTGSANEEVAVECMKAGSDDYLIKGNITRLGHAILAAINKKATIRARATAEKALRESEEKFRTIFEESPIGIEIYDANGIQVAANKASFDMFGIHDDSSAGFNLFEGTSLNEELKKKLKRGEAITYQATFDFDRVRELGQYKSSRTGKAEMEYIITPLKNQGKEDGLGYLLQVQEITERKKAEKIQQILFNISNSLITTRDEGELIGIIHEQLGTLLDTTNFYVAFYDESSGMLSTPFYQDQKDSVTSWPAAKSLTGYVILQDKSILVTQKESEELVRSGIIDMIGIPSACWLGVPLRVDGKAIGAIVVQSYDDPQAYSGKDLEMLEFVSDQIRMCIQQKRAEHKLIEAKEKAQESDRLKSAFLANMSHEIRTPMNAIVGFSGMLTDPDLSQKDRNRYSEIIKSRSDDLLHIVSDILEISRIESGTVTILKSKANLSSMLREIETEMSQKINRAGKSHLSLICEIPPSPDDITFISDPYIIKQVFNNLIDNAIKFTHTGSIRFGCHPPENGYITCFVSDTGIGISPKHQALIFEHFRQADSDDTHLYGGTGLGLSICKGSLELLGGRIWVESSYGKGSIFYFSLPYEPIAAPDMDHRTVLSREGDGSHKITPSWKGKKLLLVEDDDANMEYLKTILDHTDTELVCAYNGSELRNLYDKIDMFSMVLLDMRLPDANGWELARELKTLRPNLPVIAQTAYALSTDKEKSEESGCDGYISKPIRKSDLHKLIDKYMSQR
jgi:PAS domain S-box-containing protein